MLLELTGEFSDIIADVQVKRFRKEKNCYQLIAILSLKDGSNLFVKEYLFRNGEKKYAYHLQTKDGKFRGRWDNAPHWPELPTYPKHFHDGRENRVVASEINNLRAVLEHLRNILA